MREMKEEEMGKYFTSEKGEGKSSGDFDAGVIEDMQKVVDSIELLKKMQTVDTVAALKRIKQKENSFHKIRKLLIVLRKVAAILILPLLFYTVWQSVQIADFNQSIVQNVIATPPTLRSVFTLPDGTKVWMNGNTTITYPTFFKGKERLVELNGEAYFQVAHNKQKPFIVKSGNLLVEAVGTEFNFLSFVGETKQETLLTKGKVNILLKNERGRKVVGTLTPNQMAVYNAGSASLKVLNVDPQKYTAWKDGQIIFKNDVLSDVLNRLSRWYNVEFIYDERLKKDYAFTGSFAGEEITQILNYIELTTPITFELIKTQKDKEQLYQKTKIKIRNK
jgi:ferric-dicitrate binding protein FerR (iron transport regulator)